MSAALLQAWEKTRRRRGPDRAVLEAATGAACTFRELDERGAAWLRSHAPGLQERLAGRAVVFAVPNGIGWLEIFLGLLHAGAVAVPLDASEPPAAQQEIAVALRAGFRWDGTRLVPLAGSRRFRDPATCLIKLTSGTTGRPRPLVFTAAQLLADARQVTATMGIAARDLNYALIPFGHSYGLGNLTLPLLAHGVPLVCGTLPLPHAIAADFVRWRPTVFPSVPAVWRALAASAVSPASLASLRLAISAGAPLPAATAQEFAARFGRKLHAFYGSSETGGISFDRTGSATLRGGVGKPLRGVRIRVGADGRLRVGSAAVFSHGNSRRDGRVACWFPPDRAALEPDGSIALLGRRGTTVKLGGRRVSLTEIAARIRRLPGVNDVWVGVGSGADPVLGAAVATARPAAELRSELHPDTAAWKIPRKWLILPALPLTDRGKIDGRALQAKLFTA
ncbi:MAG TPA: class I adenylate-forming enzyme family protein [Opitutaceae bacterium]|nr:class I adenylate-forming enzyme family protein [Opitutaceae bacterium]